MRGWRVTAGAFFMLALLAAASASGGEYVFPPTDIRVNPSLPGEGSAYGIRICNDDLGNVYAVWTEVRESQETNIHFNVSRDHGKTWEETDVIINRIFGDAGSPEICCDNRGHVYVLWIDAREYPVSKGLYFNVSSDFGETWEEEDVRVDHIPFYTHQGPLSPRISCDEEGHVYVIWADSRFDNAREALFMGYASDFGATWGETDIRLDTPIGEETTIRSQMICNDGHGHVYAFWVADDASGERYDLRIEGNYSQDHGQTWLDHPFTVDDGVSDAKLPRACCDSSGTVYVLWRDERNGEFDLYVNVSRDFGVTWFEEDVCVTCDSAPEVVGNFPVICCDEWGRVYVAWWDSFDDVQVRFRGSEDYGVTWGEEKQLGSPEALPAWEPVIGCNESGHVFVAWEDARVPWTIYSTYSTDYGKTWFEGDHRLDSAPGMSTHLVLTGDRFGHFYVAWDDWRHDGVQGDIYFNVATPAVDARILTEENPVVISQAGGSFDFDVVLENNTDATIPEVRVYIDAASRSGRVKGPLFGPMVVDLHPGNPRAGGASQGIPPGVRPGLYAYRVNLAGSVDDRNLFYIRVLE